MEEKRWIVVRGDPFEGFELIGPFALREEAGEWEDLNEDGSHENYWIVELVAPEEQKED